MRNKLLALIKRLKKEYSKQKAFDIIERLLEHSNEIENFEETIEYITNYGFDEQVYEQFEDILERIDKLDELLDKREAIELYYLEDHDGGYYSTNREIIYEFQDETDE